MVATWDKYIAVSGHYFVNPSKLEIHTFTIECSTKVFNFFSPNHEEAYRKVELALRHGYNGCHYCLPEYDTGSSELSIGSLGFPVVDIPFHGNSQ
jgi:hypothetical protein